MDRPEPNSDVRRYTAYISPFGITQLQLKNPYAIACWSLFFPGAGHLFLCKYFRGYLLFIWELYVNLQAHVNLAILYSFTGKFQMAKDVVDIKWILFYIPTYFYAIWDSYRCTIELNHQYTLAAREDAEVKMFNIGLFEINYGDKRIPWHSTAWSALMPGLGDFLNSRLPAALFSVIIFIVIGTQSNLLSAIHYTFLGQFEDAKAIINPQWFLNVPSVYFYAINSAYAKTVYFNKLFDWEQSKFLKKIMNIRIIECPLEQWMEAVKVCILSQHLTIQII